MKVHDLLREKVQPVYTIASSRSVDDAVRLMAEKKAGALVVMHDEQPAGVFTERDVFRCYLKEKSGALRAMPLQDTIADKLIAAEPDDDVAGIMALMLKTDITHLPVVKAGSLIGMLTLNDLFEHRINSLNDENHQLKEYIDDLHAAGQD
jgi:CBS domain-containing protein